MFDQWTLEKNELVNEKLTLDQTLEFSQKENAMLSIKLDGLLQQLQDKQERINELHQLQKQSQENLEHYRESAREQRLNDQHQHEQQKQQLKSELKIAQDQLIRQREKFYALSESHTVSEKTCEQMQSQLQLLCSDMNILCSR